MAAPHNIPLLEPLDEVIKETMEPTVQKFTLELSQFHRDMKPTSDNVVKPDWGRDYKIIKTFRKGVAGTVHWGNTMASATTELGPDSTLSSTEHPNFAVFIAE